MEKTITTDEDYDNIIRTAVVAASAAGPLAMSPIPATDTVVVAGIWTTMMTGIARKTGHSLDLETGKKVVLAVISGAGLYWTGGKALTWIIARIPGIGWVTGSGANSVLNGTFTVWLGYSLIDLFEKEDFELDDWEFCIEYLKDAMKPQANKDKLKRIRAFFKRWTG